MNFETKWNRSKFDRHPGGGRVLVDKAGYVSAEKRITSLISAGQRLVASRRAQYDFHDQIDEDAVPDPTRDGDFDLADASQANSQAIIDAYNALIASQSDVETSKPVVPGETTPEPEKAPTGA